MGWWLCHLHISCKQTLVLEQTIPTSLRPSHHPLQHTRTPSFLVQYHNGTVSTKTLLKHHLWVASRTVYHRPPVYSPCWRDIPLPREFVNYHPEPEPEWDVKLYSLTHSLTHLPWRGGRLSWPEQLLLLLLLLMSLIWRKFEIIINAANAPCRLLQTL